MPYRVPLIARAFRRMTPWTTDKFNVRMWQFHVWCYLSPCWPAMYIVLLPGYLTWGLSVLAAYLVPRVGVG